MVDNELDMFVWVEKYRPRTIDECILSESLKKEFNGFIKRQPIPNLILKGTAGVGKTTIARALCDQLGCEYLLINGSGQLNVEELRVTVASFVSTVSFNGNRKCVIVDEADGMTPKVQDELRGFIEKHTKNAFFIFTCNHSNKIITPIHSRCSVVDFRLQKDEKPAIAKQFMVRVKEILTKEEIEFDNKVLAQVVMNFFPDFRRTLNELQRYSASGSIDAGLLSKAVETDVSDLISTIKEKSFKKMRQWCENNSDGDFSQIYQKLFDSLLDQINEVPQAVLIIAEAQYRQYFSVSQTINLVSCCTELMGTVSFK